MGHSAFEEFRGTWLVLRPRTIPCLLVQRNGLVKTVGFAKPKYVGDPINAVRIFNEKEVDELAVLDIDATVQSREPDYGLIRNLAAECRMPLSYGGGVKTIEQIRQIISLGVEKVMISAAAIENPALISRAAQCVGSQSIVVVMDVKRNPDSGAYELFTHNGTRASGIRPDAFAATVTALGAGEVVINSIDRDGAMQGYDLELVAKVRATTRRPLTVLGGAGSLADIRMLFARFGVIGAAAGSLFVFKGPYRAVLINYPRREEKDALYAG